MESCLAQPARRHCTVAGGIDPSWQVTKQLGFKHTWPELADGEMLGEGGDTTLGFEVSALTWNAFPGYL
jgi:hypothetical protein